jgi:hypothetical protein
MATPLLSLPLLLCMRQLQEQNRRVGAAISVRHGRCNNSEIGINPIYTLVMAKKAV